MTAFGWTVLSLVFLDEVLAMVAFGVWGWAHDPRWLLVWLLPSLGMLVWSLFASPKAAYGGPARRPVVKVLVFGTACWALWDTGHERAALALLAFSVVVNALAQLPGVSALTSHSVGDQRA